MKFKVYADRPLAVNSPDHLFPHGTRRDNSVNPLFNLKLHRLFGSPELRILDLGCAGGGFVESCLVDGHIAVGLEGSDYSLKRKRAAWARIPDNLFTCDLTKEFTIKTSGHAGAQEEQVRFDVITAWGVLEHILENDLVALMGNVDRHMESGGIFVMSICTTSDVVSGVELHQTVHPKEWWIDFFRRLGYVDNPVLIDYFGNLWVRGPAMGEAGNFYAILSRIGDSSPVVPARSGIGGLSYIRAWFRLLLSAVAYRQLGHFKYALRLLCGANKAWRRG